MIGEPEWLKQVETLLFQGKAQTWEQDVKTGSFYFKWGEGHSLSLGPDKVLTCVFRIDLDEIRSLIADDTTEDLSDDELCRVARQELRPVVEKYRRRLIQANFEESVESDRDQYAMIFKKVLTDATPQEASEILKWCRGTLIGG